MAGTVRSMTGSGSYRNTTQNDWGRAGRRARGAATLAAVALLLVGSGCGVLDVTPKTLPPTPTRAADQITPPVIVTVGGGPPAESTPTPGTAPTIPDATPLPRLEVPTPVTAQSAPAASPTARSSVSAAARASQLPPIAVPVVARSSPTATR